MGRANQKGRSKTEAFVRLHRGVTNSAAWQSLTCEARCLVLEVWARHNGQNNGRIPYSHRETRSALHIGSRKAAAAFRAVQDRGFLIARTKGAFQWKQRHATEWEITTEPCDGKPAKRLYQDWQRKQNPGTKVVPDGNHSSARGTRKTRPEALHGNHSGARNPQIRAPHGNHSGDTSNLPGGVPFRSKGP